MRVQGGGWIICGKRPKGLWRIGGRDQGETCKLKKRGEKKAGKPKFWRRQADAFSREEKCPEARESRVGQVKKVGGKNRTTFG